MLFLKDLFFPYSCAICEKSFKASEHVICTHCLQQLPYSNSWDNPQNLVYQKLYGRFDFEKAISLLFFTPSGTAQHLIHLLKYKNRKDIAFLLGKLLSNHLVKMTWEHEIDAIIPVPIHKNKLKERGYNQAQCIAEGIAAINQKPVWDHLLLRNLHTPTQTKKTRLERIQNVENAFQLSSTELLENKHILLVDDVLTTGATIEACALELLKVKGLKVSVAFIASTYH